MQNKIFLCVTIVMTALCRCSEANIKGAVILDEHNFDKVLSKFENVLVKFDAVYPFGEKHDAFKTVAEELKDANDLLIVTIGIKDFGDHDNQKLAERFGINTKKDWPSLRLFIKGEEEPFSLNREDVWSVNEIKKFIREYSNVYLGLPGCLEKFDKFAIEFSAAKDKEAIIENAEKEAETLQAEADIKAANTYIKFMKKSLENESFIEVERKRLNKILKEGKVKTDKKENMQLRANILTSFIPIKAEL
ncbi:endoplasmic reticulum resident protein 29 [Euwallacea fornicatus]|uniref:endoplasmic reticulum resident protein 29 n=1 Tax=Euwallacea fornicatus TaxID=995702 RepID=UPI00338EC8AC